MNSQDLADWKRHPVTQAVFSALQDRMTTMAEYLIEHAGVDSHKDIKYSGAIMASRDLLSITFDEIQETE
jgi:hypothetical protein